MLTPLFGLAHGFSRQLGRGRKRESRGYVAGMASCGSLTRSQGGAFIDMFCVFAGKRR